jgi:hypothetical protein
MATLQSTTISGNAPITSANISTQSVSSATYATTAGSAYPYRVGGVTMQMNWNGQSGQPSWVWGGNDGTNFYVYNPSNFSVAYATTAGSAPANGGTSAACSGNAATVTTIQAATLTSYGGIKIDLSGTTLSIIT